MIELRDFHGRMQEIILDESNINMYTDEYIFSIHTHRFVYIYKLYTETNYVYIYTRVKIYTHVYIYIHIFTFFSIHRERG